MKGIPIDKLVFDYMFPKPKANDPADFPDFLQKHLVNEVRAETTTFYGSLDSRESQYPGLDYSHNPHRVRLGRFPWHRRLFRAFDELGLTRSEIAGLTKWEGTIWAKERFEKEQGFRIRDSTGDCISDWVEPHLRTARSPGVGAGVEDIDEEGEDSGIEEDSDMEIDSVGLELNRRLLASAAERDSGELEEPLFSDFEEWLRKQVEEGALNSSRAMPLSSSLPPRWLNAARLGQWQQLPDIRQQAARSERVSGTIQPQVGQLTSISNHHRAPPATTRRSHLGLSNSTESSRPQGSNTFSQPH